MWVEIWQVNAFARYHHRIEARFDIVLAQNGRFSPFGPARHV